MEISLPKSIVMAFEGQISIRSIIVIDNAILEQLNTFTCLGCEISYKMEKDMT
jgi:hypothetical protein